MLGISSAASAAILPPEKLLPSDTVLVVTVPDCNKSRAIFTNSPGTRLWRDPALKAFTDKFVNKFSSDVVTPVEREFGIRFADYQGFAQGQITFALMLNEAAVKSENPFSMLLLVDTKDKSDQLKKNLAELKKKWADSGKQIKAEKIRDQEFTTFITTSDELSKTWDKIFPKGKDADTATPDATEPKKDSKKIQFTIGQTESLLILSDSPKAIEKILSRQSGGLVSSLSEQSDFQANYAAMLRDAPVYVWVNAKSLVNAMLKSMAGDTAEPASPLIPKPDKIISAMGFTGIKSIAIAYHETPEGALSQIFIGMPESSRQGLFKILAADTADSNPPPFVPVDVAKFNRWRLNIPKSWAVLETTLADISPAYSGITKMIFDSAGKDKDEKYDLKSELFGNLGNDIITYSKSPHMNSIADLNSASSLILIGSPNADKLAAAIKVAVTSLGRGGATKEREFLGRKIFSVPSATPTGKAEASLNFAASGGYVAISGDAATLEEYLRSNENKPKPLSETAGLSEAAQKVGGSGTGLFGFNNQLEIMRGTYDLLRKDSGGLTELLGGGILGGNMAPADQIKKLKEWADFSLLPPFDAISKYFYYSVYAGRFNADGFTLKFFSPMPPKLK